MNLSEFDDHCLAICALANSQPECQDCNHNKPHIWRRHLCDVFCKHKGLCVPGYVIIIRLEQALDQNPT